MSEMKSCPFCGAIPDRLHRKEPTYSVNHRSGCPETMRVILTDSIAAWNTRAVDPDVERLVEGATEALPAVEFAEKSFEWESPETPSRFLRAALAPWRKE